MTVKEAIKVLQTMPRNREMCIAWQEHYVNLESIRLEELEDHEAVKREWVVLDYVTLGADT